MQIAGMIFQTCSNAKKMQKNCIFFVISN
ncbi:hypothetical protein [Blautia luti]